MFILAKFTSVTEVRLLIPRMTFGLTLLVTEVLVSGVISTSSSTTKSHSLPELFDSVQSYLFEPEIKVSEVPLAISLLLKPLSTEL